MKRMLSLLVALICLMVFPATSLAALPEPYLFSPALDAMNYEGSDESEDSYCGYYSSEDGLVFVEVLTLGYSDYGMVGEGSFAELMELRNGVMSNVEEVPCEGVSAYPAQRLRFEAGENEDSVVVDATAIWTDSATFVYIVTVKADAWYGYMDGYEEGAAQAMVDEWISELQVDGYASDVEGSTQTDVVLVADRSCGVADAEEMGMVERYEAIIEGDFDENALADALTVLTGLNFSVDCYYADNGFVVDWQPDSTLVAGLADVEQNENFSFYDAVSLNWFMMDSLYATIRENLGVEEVYYTMDGGMELVPTELGILASIPADMPYMGSAFYFAHSDVAGDESGADAEYDYEEEIVYDEEEVEYESNDYGFFDNYIDTEFFRVGIPAYWRDLYEVELVEQAPYGYTISFSEKESGFVFSLEARWFDDEIVQLESTWQGYLGRMAVDRLGYLDLLVTYSQPAPDASEAWQTMYDTCREVVDAVLMQDGVSLEGGEYIDYEP